MRPGALVVGRYELIERRGAGAMGSVWSARHVTLGHKVAIKFLHQHVAGNEQAATRFEREARLAAQLGEASRHITRVTDHGITDGGSPFLVMELLHGEGLDERLKRESRLSLPVAAQITSQLCRALHVAHAAGVIHRDLKPANIFLCASEVEDEISLKLLDFGVAKATLDLDDNQQTREGLLVGTPNYMSPEQIVGGAIDHRSDLWAVGAIVYRMLTGKPAFTGSLSELGVRIMTTDPPAPTSVVEELPRDVDAWMKKALSKKVEQRFQSARELSDALALAAGVTSGWTGVFSPAAKQAMLSRIETPLAEDLPTRLGGTIAFGAVASEKAKAQGPTTVQLEAEAASSGAGSWYLQRGRADPIGPFTTEEVQQGLRTKELPPDANVREVSEAAWRPLVSVPEFRDLAKRAQDSDDDAERLAPVEGPKWTSQAERHVGRGGLGVNPLLSPETSSSATTDRPPADRPKKRVQLPSRDYVVPPGAHRFLAMSLGALGLTWTMMRAVLVAKVPPGWGALVDQHHVLRAGALAEIAIGAVVWPLVFLGAIGSRRRSTFGTPLVRAAASAGCIALALVAIGVPLLLSRAPGWPLETSRVMVSAFGASAAAALALCAAWLLRLFPDDPHGPSIPALSAILLGAAGALGAFLFVFWIDLVVVVPIADEPARVFTDVHAARDDAEGRKTGVAGMLERQRAQRASIVVPASSPAKLVDELRFDLESGPVLVRQVTLLDGPTAGKTVYAPAEAIREAAR